MKKTLISALFLLISISSFAQDSNTQVGPVWEVEPAGLDGLAIVLTLNLRPGQKIGECQVKYSNGEGSIMNGTVTSYSLVVEGKGKRVGIKLTQPGQLSSTGTSLKDYAYMLDAASVENKSGVKTIQTIKALVRPTRNAPYNSQLKNEEVTDLVIVTQKQNAAGVMQVVNNQSIRCTK